jgi:hypothetical protein
MTFWLAQWILKRQDEKFLRALIDTRAQVDEVTDRQVRVTLLQGRIRHSVEPYLRVFKLGWEIVRGRYWKSSSKVHGGADPVPGGSAGAGGQSVAQSGHPFPVNPLTGAAGFPSPGVAVNFPPLPSSFFADAGIVAGEVVAYRCWRLGSDGLLYSVFKKDFCWKPGEIAEGDAARGTGIHAFKSLILMCQFASGHSEGYVTGTVYLWGDVYEHERGYRASKAAIRSIDDSSDYDAKTLRKLYGLNKRKKKGLSKPEA